MSTEVYNIDLATAEGYNATKDSEGTWRARLGLVSCVVGPVGQDQRNLYATSCRSISGTLYHYVFNISNVAITGVPLVSIICTVYDEEWVSQGTVDVGVVQDATAPWTSAIVNGQIIFNSPGISRPLVAFIGSTPIAAVRVESKIPDNQAIDLLPGQVCTFGDRIVWAYFNQIYINEPFSPLTISAGIGFTGRITDVFQQGSGGNLVVVTTDGIYTLPPDGLSGFSYVGVISKTTHYSSLEPGNAATSRGAIHGLIDDGLMNLQTGDVTKLTVNRKPRKLTKFFGAGYTTDYRRAGKLIPYEKGYLVTFGTNQPFAMVDIDSKSITWWDDTTINEAIVGYCTDSSGDPVIVFKDGIRRIYGNVLTTEKPPALALEFPVPGISSHVVREIYVTTTGDGSATVRSAVRNALTESVVPPPPQAELSNVALWGTGISLEAEFRSRRHQMAVRTDGIFIEVGFDADQKLQNVQVKTKTQSPFRVTF